MSGRYHSSMTISQWCEAFVAEHDASEDRMREALKQAGIDIARIRWSQPPGRIAFDVFEHVSVFYDGRSRTDILVHLVGGRDSTKSQCACGKH